MRKSILAAAMAILAVGAARADGLWSVYDQSFAHARYIDLTHTIAPGIPVWHGFKPSTFAATTNPDTGKPYTYKTDGSAATHYDLQTDQLGTQLDPPAHWAPEYPAIDEIPPTYSLRKLVVISIVPQARKSFGYQMTVDDILAWETVHGRVPEGAVVFIRSDWSKRWPDPKLASETQFPGVTLKALQFLHLERHILFHGHEALDTDTTPTLEGEAWLMHHGYTQAEGVANLDQVPETGCLVAFGFPKFKGGTGGYARYIAICPEGTKTGVAPSAADAPLPRAKPLHWDAKAGVRVR